MEITEQPGSETRGSKRRDVSALCYKNVGRQSGIHFAVWDFVLAEMRRLKVQAVLRPGFFCIYYFCVGDDNSDGNGRSRVREGLTDSIADDNSTLK